jgi:hypothetical protein
VLSVGTLDLIGSAQLDLNDNALIVRNGNPANVTSEIQSGYNQGLFNGPGIVSTAAATNTSHLTAIGVMPNFNGLGGATDSTFQGQAVNPNDVLVRYTYYGDANLDGKVDGSDYSRIDSAAAMDQTNPNAASGWSNGDFNYDGSIDGSDYTLIDNGYNVQGAAFSAGVAAKIAVPQVETRLKPVSHFSDAAVSLFDTDDTSDDIWHLRRDRLGNRIRS